MKTLLMVLCITASSFPASFRANLFSGVDAVLENPLRGNGYFGGRFMARERLTGGITFEGAWEVSTLAGDFEGLERWSPYRLDDFDPVLLGDTLKILGNLDRLFMGVRFRGASLTLGRQPVFWGLGKTYSPSDFVDPMPLYTIDREFRTGVDGARLRIPLGVMEELDLGFLAGDGLERDENGAWIRARVTPFGLDVTPVLAVYRGCSMASAGLNGTLSGFSWWTEGAFTEADGTRYGTLTAGLDHRLLNSGYGWLEYTYNGAGTPDTGDYPSVVQSPPFTRAGAYLLGMHYLNPGVAVSPHPLWNLQGTVIGNLSDGSAGISLNTEYRPADGLMLKIGCLAGIGGEQTELGGMNRAFLEMRLFL